MTVSGSDENYACLPDKDATPANSSWGVWKNPELGTLNRLTPETVLNAVGLVSSGNVYSLNLPMGSIDPPLFQRSSDRHVLTNDDDAFARDDLFESWNTQSSTHLDGFRHVRDEMGFYGGLEGPQHGMHHWANHGIVARGVLVDVARYRAEIREPINPREAFTIGPTLLQETLDFQGTEVGEGDFLLLRTGWLEWYRRTDPRTRKRISVGANLATPGLEASEDSAEWLWDNKVCGVAADNPSLEAWPINSGTADELSLHVRALARLGIPFGELWDLDSLSAVSATEQKWESLIVSTPLALPGGCASPANVVAIR